MNLESILRVLRYYKKLILTVVISTTLVVLVGSLVWQGLSPFYEGHAEIVIFPTNAELNLSKDVSNVVNASPSNAITQTYSDVTLSRTFAEKTVASLWGKYMSKPQPPTFSKQLYIWLLKPVVDKLVKIYCILNYGKFVDPGLFEYYVEKLIKRTTITPEPGSYTVSIDVIWDDPRIAADAANIIARLYIEESLQDNRKASLKVRRFLENKIRETQGRLNDIKNAILVYKDKEAIVSLPQQGSSLVQNMTDYETQLNDTRIKIVALEAKKRKLEQELARMSPQVVAAREIVNNPVVQELETGLANKEIKLASLLEEYKNYKGDSKAVEDLRVEINNIRKKIEEQTRQIPNMESHEINPLYQNTSQKMVFLNADIISLKTKARQLELTLAGYTNRGKGFPYREEGTNELLRQKTLIESSLELLNQRYQEARIAEISKLSSIRIKDTAVPPDYPKHPMILVNSILSFPAGVIIALFAVMFNEFKNIRIRNEDDLKQVTDMPVIGMLPYTNGIKPATVDGSGIPARSASHLLPYKPQALDTYLQPFSIIIRNADAGGKLKTCLFISATQDDSKSAVIANLANNLSAHGKKVLVIDANFFSPRMGYLFGVERNGIPCIREVLARRIPYQQSIYKVNPNLDILMGENLAVKSGDPNQGGAAIDFEYLASIAAQASDEYHHVLIDSSPLFNGISADMLIKGMDMIIPVVKSGNITKNEFNLAMQRLKGVKENIPGVVIAG